MEEDWTYIDSSWRERHINAKSLLGIYLAEASTCRIIKSNVLLYYQRRRKLCKFPWHKLRIILPSSYLNEWITYLPMILYNTIVKIVLLGRQQERNYKIYFPKMLLDITCHDLKKPYLFVADYVLRLIYKSTFISKKAECRSKKRVGSVGWFLKLDNCRTLKFLSY